MRNSQKLAIEILLGCLLGCIHISAMGISAMAAEPPLQTLIFLPSTGEVLNPERGFFKFRDLSNSFGYNNVRSQGQSLIYGRILANNFRNAPLSQSFLDGIQAGFDAVRANGIKVKPRVQYNDDGGADAPKSVILGHIQQLKPLWEANKDVIYTMDAGFIGGWGEWHSSTNGLDNNSDRSEILSAVLNALPADRMVGIRTPHFKREVFNGSPADDTLKITAANAFDGSDISRVGHLNDCFLASASDFGTYITPGWSRQAELGYIGGEGRFSPHGGETCSPSTLSDGPNAISEMEQLHTDYLNIDYHPAVIQGWVNDGSFDEIDNRLGYRFELQTADLPNEVKPSGLLEIQFDINNVGFGELFNPRNVEVTLENNATGTIVSAPLQVDPRFWSGGTSNQVQAFLGIPAGMQEGTYTVGLKMPDIEQSLQNDIRYSIQFANMGIWNAQKGINVLKTDLAISKTAAGASYAGLDQFGEIVNPGQLQLSGDYNGNGIVDAADYTVWLDSLGAIGMDLAADGTGDDMIGVPDGDVDQFDYDFWKANFGTGAVAGASGQAVPEPSAVLLLFAEISGLAWKRVR